MNNKLGQEPAYPEIYINSDGTKQSIPGMSKRFYAACAAMNGLLSNQLKSGGVSTNAGIVKNAYELADELLKQENQ